MRRKKLLSNDEKNNSSSKNLLSKINKKKILTVKKCFKNDLKSILIDLNIPYVRYLVDLDIFYKKFFSMNKKHPI